MTIKLIITLSTLLIGTYITRKELKALYTCVTEREYVDLTELNRAISRQKPNLV